MTIAVSKENVDTLAAGIISPIEVKGTCDLCGRPVHGLFGMLEARELKTTGHIPSTFLLHNGGAFRDCLNLKARFILDIEE